MTRDEAEKIAKPFWCGDAGQAVDTLVALGVLKLDKELSAKEKLKVALYESYSFSVDSPGCNSKDDAAQWLQWLLNRLDSLGVKVVNKSE
jgi:hypothetical protein